MTAQRLAGSRLEFIRDPGLVWEFGPERVVISSAGGPLPPDLAGLLPPAPAPDGGAAPARVAGTWRLDGSGLVLSAGPADGGSGAGSERRLSVRPAGRLRVDLGERQYNLYPAGSGRWRATSAPVR